MRADARLRTKRIKMMAEARLQAAANQAEFARNEHKKQILARRRVDDVLTLIEARFHDYELNKENAFPYAQVLASALNWEQNRDYVLVAEFTAAVFPVFTFDELLDIAEETDQALSGQEIARMLWVTLEERQLLGLRMIGACDLSKPEFEKFKIEQRKQRNAESKRRSRARNLETRRADEASKRHALVSLANEHGKSVRTIREWIKKGKLSFSAFRGHQ